MKKPIKKSTSTNQQQKQSQPHTGISEQNFKIYLRIKPTLPGPSSPNININNININLINHNQNSNNNNNSHQTSTNQQQLPSCASTPSLLPYQSSSHSSSQNQNHNHNYNPSHNYNQYHNSNSNNNNNHNTNNNNNNSNNILKILPNNKIQITSPYYTVNQIDRVYSYEQIFDESVNNSMVFERTMLQPVDNVLQGYNSTVFIYGMTGSGKTYTMFGTAGGMTQKNNNNYNNNYNGNVINKGMIDEDGLVPMTIDYMFAEIEKQPQIKSQITVSFYQIYNQNIRDLLTTNSPINSNNNNSNNNNNNYMNNNNYFDQSPHLNQNQPSLVIMEDPIHGIFVNGLTQVIAQDKNQIKDIIYAGVQKRAMNATRSNQVSSRSHAILQFSVKRYINVNVNANVNECAGTGTNFNNNLAKGGNAGVLQSKFFMIDLAGNQKTANNNESRRFIQGVNINKSLLTLGKCLSILAQKKSSYVPFRDSKLTRILKQSLGGNSKTVMIACVSSERRFYQQTLNTLKYSNIARKIKNKGVKHNFKIISKEEMPDCRNFVNNGHGHGHGHGQLSNKNGNINGNQLPIHGEIQQKIKNTLSNFLSSVQSKIKIEQFLQNLQNNRKQNEQFLILNQDDIDYQTCKNNIKKINDTINQFIRPYEKHLQKLYQSYNQLMENIRLIIVQQKQKQKQKQKDRHCFNKNVMAEDENENNQAHGYGYGRNGGSIHDDLAESTQDKDSTQIMRLKQIIAHQNRKLEYYQSKQSNDHCNNSKKSTVNQLKGQQFDNFAHRSLYLQGNNNVNSANSNMQSVNINRNGNMINIMNINTNNNNSNNNSMRINSGSQKQTTMPVFNFNPKLTHNNSNNENQPERSQSRPKNLTINCGNTAQNLKLNQQANRSTSTALQLLNTSNISAGSQHNKKPNKFQKEIVINLNADQIDKKNYQNSKDQFVRKLKQTERKAKGIGAEEISDLLREQENNRYELGNVEMSMIRKLKFFQREKSIQKSNSLGKLMTKTYEPIRMGLGLRRN